MMSEIQALFFFAFVAASTAAVYFSARNQRARYVLRCPLSGKTEEVSFVLREGVLVPMRRLRVAGCSAFADPCSVECGQDCLCTRGRAVV